MVDPGSPFREGLARIGFSLGETQRKQLSAYISEIELWNSRVDLVRIRCAEDLIVRHILDCLAAAARIAELPPTEWADLGSGAGLPGIPLAIALPDLKFSLVERSGKRAAFLRGAVALLGLGDRVEVVEQDVGRINRRYEGVVFRAFRPFSREVVHDIARVAAPGATLAAYKGRRQTIETEIDALGELFEGVMIERIQVPFLDEERHLVIATRRG